MVHIKNIKKENNFITFDGYICNREDKHFFMKIDLNTCKPVECSLEMNHDVTMAMMKVLYAVAGAKRENKTLPRELVSASH